MAYKVTDFTRSVAAGGDYPYGDVQDDPGGTLVNRMALGDVWQFLQRLMASAGITPSSTPDNLANGYQTMQALNTIMNGPLSAMATMLGCATGTYIPTVLQGLVSTTTMGTTTVTAGWFLYNGYLYYFPGGRYTGIISGDAIYLVMGTTDALPTASLSMLVNTTPDAAGQCQLAHIVAMENIVGAIAAITAAPTVLALNSFTTYNTGYSDGSITPAYCKDAVNVVRLIGIINASSAAGAGGINVTALPAGFRPAHDKVFPCVYYNITSSLFTVVGVQVNASGFLTVLHYGTVLGGAGSYLMIDTITFPTYY